MLSPIFSACGFAQTNAAAASPGDARVRRQGNGSYVAVTNRSNSPMSAYAVLVVSAGGRKIRHFYDARIRGNPPIRPGASYEEARPGVAVDARLLAAVYTDGTTFGSAKEVADLMERRKAKLAALTRTVSLLCDAQGKGTDLQTIVSSLETLGSEAQREGVPMLSSIRSAAFKGMAEKVQRSGLQTAFDSLAASGSALMKDPIAGEGGRLYIDEIPEHLACLAPLPAMAHPLSKPASAHP